MIFASSIQMEGCMLEESMGFSNARVESEMSSLESSGTWLVRLLKSNGFSSPVWRSCIIPMVPPVYMSSTDDFAALVIIKKKAGGFYRGCRASTPVRTYIDLVLVRYGLGSFTQPDEATSGPFSLIK